MTMDKLVAYDHKVIARIECRDHAAWLNKLMRLSTRAGSTFTLGPLCTGLWLLFTLVHNVALARAYAVVIVVMICYNAFKTCFRRQRPQNAYSAGMKSSSFPSGHSASAATAYGFSAYLLARGLVLPLALLVLVAGLAVILLVGVSRVYLGAHYPSDVVAGWILGFSGLLLLIQWFD